MNHIISQANCAPDTETTSLTHIKQCTTDGREIYVILCKTGTSLANIGWIDDGSAVINPIATLPALQPCVQAPVVVDGQIVSFAANGIPATLPGVFDSLWITKPEGCCRCTISTNLGDFIIPEGVTAYSPESFGDGQITSVIVTGDCDLSEVTVTLQRSGG